MSSISSALNAAVSGLQAEGAAITAVSENIANANTTAYKTASVNFQELVTGSGINASGGVLYSNTSNVGVAGQITSTATDTNIAINGQGFFVVSGNLTNKPSAYTYSRNGTFSTDKSGYLVNNEGFYLLGQATNSAGAVTAANQNDINSLAPINVNAIKGAAKPTANITEKINLPADATTSGSFQSSAEVFDSLGVSNTVVQTWTKTASNAWTLSLANPVLTSNSSGSATGTIAPNNFQIVFNGDGSLQSIKSTTAGVTTNWTTPPVVAITGWTTGANASSIALDLGTIGATDGLTQFSSNTSTPALTISSVTGDGLRFGNLSSLSIDDSGLVTAGFDNGLKQPIDQIPIATFPNPDGLTHISGSVYAISSNAGNYVLQQPNQGSAGSIVASAVEESTTDTSTEFNKLIVAQQAYSAAAQIISTVKSLYDTLQQAVR